MSARATWFLTHRCNLVCSYCTTIASANATPEADDTLAIAEGIVACNPEIVVVTGGEPTMHPRVQDVVNYFNRVDQEFVIITNATRPWKLSGVRNVSCSVDLPESNVMRRHAHPSDESYKSAHGYRFLLGARDLGMNVSASIVAGRHNAEALPRLVRSLCEDGIRCVIGVLQQGSPIFPWRFRQTIGRDARLTTMQAFNLSYALTELHDAYPHMILTDRGYLAGIAEHGHRLDWHCSEAADLVVDSDGTILTCQDWWGPTCKSLNVRDARLDPEWENRWVAAHANDNPSCPGCYWNCTYQAESGSSSVTPGPRTPRNPHA